MEEHLSHPVEAPEQPKRQLRRLLGAISLLVVLDSALIIERHQTAPPEATRIRQAPVVVSDGSTMAPAPEAAPGPEQPTLKKASLGIERTDRLVRPFITDALACGDRYRPLGGAWRSLRQKEAAEDYRSQSNPKYKGAYQFDQPTWDDSAQKVGLSQYRGVPAHHAPSYVQDLFAMDQQSRRGWEPWPTNRQVLRLDTRSDYVNIFRATATAINGSRAPEWRWEPQCKQPQPGRAAISTPAPSSPPARPSDPTPLPTPTTTPLLPVGTPL